MFKIGRNLKVKHSYFTGTLSSNILLDETGGQATLGG